MARVVVLPNSDELSIVNANTLAGEDIPAVDPVTGCPTALQSLVVSEDPKITVVPNFLSAAECQHLWDIAEGHWMQSLVGALKYDDEDKDKVKEPTSSIEKAENRTSSSCVLRYAMTTVTERIEHRLAQLAGLPVEQLERLVMVRYLPGQKFGEHHDGKFRPKTIFLYINDVPEGEGGDTFFPRIGFSFVPCGGAAVMWTNPQPDGREDSRLIHNARPPLKTVKYGINCFFNEAPKRVLRYPTCTYTLEGAAVVDVQALLVKKEQPIVNGGYSDVPADAIRSFVLMQTPRITVVPFFATEADCDHLLGLIDADGGPIHCPFSSAGGPSPETAKAFQGATRSLRTVKFKETPIVEALEWKLADAAKFSVEHLGCLRIVHPGSESGLCSRGAGQKCGSICLGERDEVFFPHLGLRLLLRRGDLLLWPTVGWLEDQPPADGERTFCEELRTRRVHLPGEGGASTSSVEASFHDQPVRAEIDEDAQRRREFGAAAAP